MLKLKMLIIKIFLLFFCHELLKCLISENLNFTSVVCGTELNWK